LLAHPPRISATAIRRDDNVLNDRRSEPQPPRRRKRRTAGVPEKQSLPWKQIRNSLAPIEPLSADEIESIHQASLRVLAELGMKVTDLEARKIYAEGGGRVNDSEEMVYLDPEMVAEVIKTVPAEYIHNARNPNKSVTIGGNHITFSGVGGPAFVSDLDRGRRPGTYAELCDYKKLFQTYDIIHYASGGFEPLDLPENSRHLDVLMGQIRYTDKCISTSLLGSNRARDGLNMACILFGIEYDDLPQNVVIGGGINTNSPRLLDGPMAGGLIELAQAGQPVIVTPFTLAGAMAPVTIIGAITQQNAEALAGIVLTQLVRPGVPTVYGGFTSNVDMRTGSPAFGTPEQTKASHITGQLCRRYKIPFRSSNTNASTSVDAQSAYESEMSLWGAVMGHANRIAHGGGWLEGGLVASFEKLIIDVEMMQMMAEFVEPLVVNDETLAIGAMREVQPGGHYFGTAHTMERYDSAFYSPVVSDWTNFENWKEAGGLDSAQRANAIWKQAINDYEQPPLDPAIVEELEDYVERRKRELIGADAVLR
jgi:trimethylamine--corrinoid protein Co-methyltransferase